MTSDWVSEVLREGDLVVAAQQTGEPTTLLAHLVQQVDQIPHIEVFVGRSLTDVLNCEDAQRLPLVSFGAMGGLAQRIGPLKVLPGHFADMPRHLDRRASGRLVLLVLVSPADENGQHSLGCAVDYTFDLLDRADIVVAEVSDQVPRTNAPTIGSDRIARMVKTSRRLPHPKESPPGPTQRAIARHVARMIPDGAAIQLGLGSFATAVGDALTDHRGLRVRSTLAGDWLLTLADAGALSQESDAVAVSELAGSDELHARAEQLGARLLPVSELTKPSFLAGEEALVAVNSAVEVDLTGQVNAETLEQRYVGGVTGQPDFLRAAQRTPTGCAVVALPATAGQGLISRIVPRLTRGTVTTPRSSVDVVVTEYGIAELRGLSLGERADALIAIAAPEHRTDLSIEVTS